MPTKPQPRITQWSYSRFKDHAQCPASAKYKYIDKVPQGEKAPAMVRGDTIHKEAEAYLKRLKPRLPVSLKLFSKEFSQIRTAKALAEGEWAMTVQWAPTEWFGHNVWCRVKLDAHYQIAADKLTRVIDFKTGKIYSDNKDQMELYAIAGFSHYPGSQAVSTELWYLDQGEEVKETYERKQLAALQKKWKEKVIPLLTEKRFAPRPGDYCSRCPFSKRKGGPCKF